VTPAIITVAGIGLALGFRHAFEPDHLAVVSTLATRQASPLAAARLGLAWAVGHTTSVGVVVAAIITLGIRFPPSLWPVADLLVGALLIALGGSVLYRYWRGGWHLHAHSHGTGDEDAHLHLHSHAESPAHGHAHPPADLRRSLAFGLLHGLAGSAAILVLLVAAAPTRGAQLAYFLAFGTGTAVGMLGVSLTLAGLVKAASRRGAGWARALHLGSAAASIVAGAVLAVTTAAQLLPR
jgi:ABC-type nickel/cobalt efflux system permease component RcnA